MKHSAGGGAPARDRFCLGVSSWVISLCSGILAVGMSGAAQGNPVLRFSPPVVTLTAGGAETVEARVEGMAGTGLAAFQLDLLFAPSLLDLQNPNESLRGIAPPFAPLGDDLPLCEQARGTLPCPDPPWLLRSTGREPLGVDRSEPGRLLVAFGTSGVPLPPTGDGVLALITVSGVEAGASLVELDVEGSILADSSEPPASFPFVSDPLIVIVEGATPLPDQDGDGIPDVVDNCIATPNGSLIPDSGGNLQLDADRDGFGNACDADLNNDGVVNFLDLGLLKARFFTPDPVADLNGDGVVNFLDLGLMKARFFQPPGPTGRVP